MKIKSAINQSKNIPVYNLKLTHTKQMLNPSVGLMVKALVFLCEFIIKYIISEQYNIDC